MLFHQLTLVIQFSSESPGTWHEQWRLQTIPILGSDKRNQISISFWGKALVVDHSCLAREKLDKELDRMVRETYTSHWRNNLTKYFPIRSREVIMQEAIIPDKNFFVLDDVALFEERNPKFYYRSHAIAILYQIYRKLNCPNAKPVGKEAEEVVNKKGGTKLLTPVAVTVKEEKETVEGLILQTVKRREMNIASLQRHVYGLSEELEDKASKVEKVNLAISIMKYPGQSPPMRHFKYIVFRAGLALALDEVAVLERTLRRHLGLLSDDEATKRSTFMLTIAEQKKQISKSKIIPVSKKAHGSGTTGAWVTVKITNPAERDINKQQKQVWNPQPLSERDYGGKGKQYHEKLWLLIYRRLCEMVESLQPLMNWGGFQLDPLLPKAEL